VKTEKKLPKIIVVCGPTATGKSDLAVALARRFDGEVVSADSRQVYRGLDIGAGKITQAEMQGVPHHLLDVADPAKARYTVEDFQRDASTAVADIVARGKRAIVCGGTGFYIDALVHNTQFPNVAPNPRLRTALQKRTCASLMKTLTKLDPKRAAAIDPDNKVRIIRAIEIAKILGAVPKVRRTKRYETLWIGLALDHDALREKIRARLSKRMQNDAMVREAERLHAHGVSWKRMQEFGLEYRHLARYLQNKISKDEMLSAIEIESLQFAKRQMTWFKREKAIQWFNPSDTDAIETAVEKFLA
jgi:tRNA dimethylallyltransferase